MRCSIRAAAIVLLMLPLLACSTLESRESRREAANRYVDFAGEPIDSFHYLGRLDRWRTIARDRLVVWTTTNKAYLLTITGGCFDLESATGIGVTSKDGSSVSRGFDSVLLPNGQRCMITEIRPVDYEAVKAEEREAAK